MRILQVTDLYAPVIGGLENHVGDLSAQLVNDGHEVLVATLTPAAVSRDGVRCVTVSSAAAKLIHYQNPRRRFHPPLPDPRAHSELRRLIAEFRPDVIHGHSWLAVSLPRSAMRRLVFTAHDYALACQLRTFINMRGEVCDGPGLMKCVRCAADSTPGVLRHPAMTIGTRAGRHLLRPRAVIAVSERVRERLHGQIDCDIEVIPNFVGARVTEAHGSTPASRDFALFAGDPGWHKGVEMLASAWSDAGTTPSVPLLMAMTRPDTLALPSGAAAVQLGRSEAIEAIRNALCVVIPSVWEDPCPTVALEALAMGTPIVASAIGGLPEIVSHEVNGLLVPPRVPHALRAAVDRLAGDPQLVAKLSAGARLSVTRFTAERVVPRIVEVYERVASS